MKPINIVAHAVAVANDASFPIQVESFLALDAESCDTDLCLEELEIRAIESDQPPELIEFFASLEA